MKTLKIKLQDIDLLDAEVSGLTSSNQETGETKVIIKGLINENISLVDKYWLNNLSKQISEIKSNLEKLRTELITKLGVQDDNGSISIPIYLENKEINPNYTEFQNEYLKLLSEEHELKFKPIPLNSLSDIKSEYPYTFILENLVNENEQ